MKLKLVVTILPLLTSIFLFASVAPAASGQTEPVTAQPGYINLGMNTSISVTAPGIGTYQVIVETPNGTKVQTSDIFTAAGQKQNVTFGANATGFKALVDQVGTYNVFV